MRINDAVSKEISLLPIRVACIVRHEKCTTEYERQKGPQSNNINDTHIDLRCSGLKNIEYHQITKQCYANEVPINLRQSVGG